MKTNQSVSSSSSNQASLANYVNRVLKLGLDVHYRQVTVAMQEDGGRIKAAGKMSHGVFWTWVDKKLKEGWQIYSCYEAGASGYWLHRQLVEQGVKNLVVAPKEPQYPPVRRLAAGLVKGKRAKKRLLVEAARRLAIVDLWRLATGQTTPE